MATIYLKSGSSSGFTMIELMVVLGLVSLAAVYGSQMLVSLGRGVKGNQEAADFVQAQGTGYYALSTNPHQFCVDSKIIGLKFPTRDEVSAYMQSQADPSGAATVPPDLLNIECTKYPYGVPGAQVSFVPKADRLLGALPVESLLKASEDPKARGNERRREVSSNNLSEQQQGQQQQGQKIACQRFIPKNYMDHDPDYSGPVPQPPKIISVPFTLGINRTTGGPIAREMVVSLKVDQDGVIADCTPLGQSGGGEGISPGGKCKVITSLFQRGKHPLMNVDNAHRAMEIACPSQYPMALSGMVTPSCSATSWITSYLMNTNGIPSGINCAQVFLWDRPDLDKNNKSFWQNECDKIGQASDIAHCSVTCCDL